MRMMQSSSIGSKGRNLRIDNNHDANRIYRGIIDCATKLESRELDANTFGQLFTDNVNQLRQRLREQCILILLSSPVEYGRRVEEVLWRKSYHNLMQYYKRWKKKVTADDICLLEIHFTSALGHYNNLLLSISKHFRVSLRKIIPYAIPYAKIDDWTDVSRELPSDEVTEWCHQSIHRILIYMGDLARYLHDIGQNAFHDVAIRYYDAALIWDPDAGMPFNQIGTLSDNANYGLDSAYYYWRCMMCVKPFEGAENNLKRILQNNENQIEQFNKELINISEESFQVVKRAYCKFLKLCDDLWFVKESHGTSTNSSSGPLTPFVHEVLFSLKAAFNLKTKMSTVHMPTYLSPFVAFEIGVISLMIIDRMQQNDESQTVTSSAATFAFTFMMYAIESCHRNLRLKLGIDESKHNGVLNFSPGMSKENTPELSPRRALSRLRRRKAAINYDDGNALSLDMDNDSDLSELEETALSTIDALEIGSDISDSDDDDNDDNKLDIPIVSSDEEPSSVTPKGIEGVKQLHAVLPAESLLNFILNDTPLPTIKMFCDWLRVNPNYIAFISNSLKGFFEEFVSFANTLIGIEEKVLLSFPKLIELKWCGSNWVQKYPLSSDLSLSNVKFMRSAFKGHIEFECERELSEIEKGFLCIQSVLAFCFHLTDLTYFVPNNFSHSITFSANDKRFKLNSYTNGTHFSLYDNSTWSEVKSDFAINNGVMSPFSEIIEPNNLYASSLTNDNNEEDVKRQKQKMRNMAHLWLKAEVSKLEKDVMKGGAMPQLPPYLVLDSSAYDYLNLIKQLAVSKRFIIVVPKTVLSSLDHKKKVSAHAREAIRWLETEIQRGNRVIRFQKDHEKCTLSPIKYPKKKDKDACDYYDLLECCNYLNKNSFNKANDGDASLMPMVTLLRASNHKWPPNADGVAKSIGIDVESVDSFVSKWQNFAKAKT